MMVRSRRAGFVPTLPGGVLILGGAGFLTGLILLVFSRNQTLSHLALILTVASPVIAFWRLMKPRLAPHCPRPSIPYDDRPGSPP
jgi:hypothetical protein